MPTVAVAQSDEHFCSFQIRSVVRTIIKKIHMYGALNVTWWYLLAISSICVGKQGVFKEKVWLLAWQSLGACYRFSATAVYNRILI